MNISTRLFLVFIALTLGGIGLLAAWLQEEMRPRYLEAQEEILVDFSQILAAVLSTRAVRLQGGRPTIDADFLDERFLTLTGRAIDARIYELEKDFVDVRIYVTDAAGRVILDTDVGRDLGADYSRWRDVSLTLEGRYGARSTTGDPLFQDGTTMYVAAPVTYRDEIIGVVSVGKPTRNAERFLERLLGDIRVVAFGVAAAALLVGLLLHGWLARPLGRLADYARAVSLGERVAMPRLGRNEVGRVGEALEQMRVSLDGKTYVEDYVQALTHELKSPVAAIRGAAELLAEDMPAADRARFIANIRDQSDRMQELIERLLDLAALERRPSLERLEPVELAPLVEGVIEGLAPLALRGRVRVETAVPSRLVVLAEPFLLAKALNNLMKNAIEFSGPDGVVTVRARREDERVRLSVSDQGPGIPEYARDRVFDRFYALPKPDGTRGSGLGLSFVKEIAELLGAEVVLETRTGAGAEVALRLNEAR